MVICGVTVRLKETRPAKECLDCLLMKLVDSV
jgi:hypothetical protein